MRSDEVIARTAARRRIRAEGATALYLFGLGGARRDGRKKRHRRVC
jgi:hypothetical protein